MGVRVSASSVVNSLYLREVLLREWVGWGEGVECGHTALKPCSTVSLRVRRVSPRPECESDAEPVLVLRWCLWLGSWRRCCVLDAATA